MSLSSRMRFELEKAYLTCLRITRVDDFGPARPPELRAGNAGFTVPGSVACLLLCSDPIDGGSDR